MLRVYILIYYHHHILWEKALFLLFYNFEFWWHCFKSKLYDKKWALQKVIYNIGSFLFIFKGVLRLEEYDIGRYIYISYHICILRLWSTLKMLKPKILYILEKQGWLLSKRELVKIIFSLVNFLVLCYHQGRQSGLKPTSAASRLQDFEISRL